MSNKIYKMTDEVSFSIDIYRTIEYIQYDDCYRPPGYLMHLRIKLFFDKKLYLALRWHGDSTSIYIPYNEVIKKEAKKIIKQKEKYEPSDEIIHLIRIALLIIMKYRESQYYDMPDKAKIFKDTIQT